MKAHFGFFCSWTWYHCRLLTTENYSTLFYSIFIQNLERSELSGEKSAIVFKELMMGFAALGLPRLI